MQAYAEYLLGLGLAPSTVRMYRALMRKAAAWAHETGVDLSSPAASDLAELREMYVESSATLRQLRCALQHYWTYKGVDPGPVKALRVPKKAQPNWRGLPNHDARRLAHTAVGWHPEGTATLVAMFTGLRRAEIAAMRWDRFSHDMTRYKVLGKGLATREVPIVPSLRSVLTPVRGGFVWLFPGERRLHVAPSTIWEWVHRVADEAGIYVSPHPLRHTAVNRIYQHAKASGSGDALRVAQRFAGHARLETTEVYVESITDDEVAAAAEDALDWLAPYGVEGVA